MTSTYYPITGIQVGLGPLEGQVPLRQEVDAWYTDPNNVNQVNLFFLALAKFQSLPVTDKLSYYQVAGIHGQPLVPWDEKTTSKSPGSGYCTHNSILFPDWHRPYILLYEQRIHEIMINDIIPTFPDEDQDKLTESANAWRLPYWDWAAKKKRESSRIATYEAPLIVKEPTVTVQTSTGPTEIPNPMHSFRTERPMGEYGINALHPVGGFPYDICKATSKCPPPDGPTTQTEWINGVQNDDQIAASLRTADWYEGSRYTDTLGEAVYRLFSQSYFSNYDAFASTRYSQGMSPPNYLSLEDIHNNVHGWIGGPNGGHMSIVPVAAFDPIFWLHHCNVDRQFAIWQSLNPTSWFSDRAHQLPDDGTWSIRPGAIDTPNTPLAPFHTNLNGTMYTSNSVRDWTKLGYTYPELQPWLAKYEVDGQFSQTAYTKDIRAQVNRLYRNPILIRPPIPIPRLPPILDPQPVPKPTLPNPGGPVELREAVAHGAATSVKAEAQPEILKIVPEHDIEEHDYIVNILYERFALQGSPFSVHIYIGKDTRVGSIYNFSTPAHSTGTTDGCENCRIQEDAHTLATGQVPITHALLQDVQDDEKPLSSLNPDEVEAYLTQTLHWKVTKSRGIEVPLESIPSLKVALAVGKGTHFSDEHKLSHFRDYRILHAVTEGRAGGCNRNDNL
ncbi:Di-copper centre-containing protein [Sistotremastrum suecicum HHB10207 ss-3]|uniref:tyrosinase n=1 Tax=Sistotremastrum suecicum HHB10207 ss-3 TaxID=1314776 RepID=A0A166DTI6_9AGAM|nr:Di-copper centre-containing protein [Sistotremastrum suecicum HHB10207 ss-3]